MKHVCQSSSPRQHIRKSKSVNTINNFDKRILKKIILFMSMAKYIISTVKTILSEFKEAMGYKGALDSLRTIIHDIGFQ